MCGKHVSWYTQLELWLMLKRGVDPNGNSLTSEQIQEMTKVYKMKKEQEVM